MQTEHEQLQSQLELLEQLRATRRRMSDALDMIDNTIHLHVIRMVDCEPLDEREEDCLRKLNAKLGISEEDYLKLTREQVISAARVMDRNLPVQEAHVGEYLGLKFPHIFIGIEKDGYAHS